MENISNLQRTGSSQLIGTLWITGGAITIGLSEVAVVLGRTGNRLYAYDGGYAFWIGLLLIVLGGVRVFRETVRNLSLP